MFFILFFLFLDLFFLHFSVYVFIFRFIFLFSLFLSSFEGDIVWLSEKKEFRKATKIMTYLQATWGTYGSGIMGKDGYRGEIQEEKGDLITYFFRGARNRANLQKLTFKMGQSFLRNFYMFWDFFIQYLLFFPFICSTKKLNKFTHIHTRPKQNLLEPHRTIKPTNHGFTLNWRWQNQRASSTFLDTRTMVENMRGYLQILSLSHLRKLQRETSHIHVCKTGLRVFGTQKMQWEHERATWHTTWGLTHTCDWVRERMVMCVFGEQLFFIFRRIQINSQKTLSCVFANTLGISFENGMMCSMAVSLFPANCCKGNG